MNVEAAIHKNDKWLIIKRSEKEEHAPGLLALVGGKVETKNVENNANFYLRMAKYVGDCPNIANGYGNF